MKTANPNMDIFDVEWKAKKAFDQIDGHAHLLKATPYCEKYYTKGFFVETLQPGEETAIEYWPKHYELIESK
jgi:hypothetical protein